MKFNKIVAVDRINLDEGIYKEIENYTKEFILYNDYPNSDEEIIKRVGNADCLLVSYKTIISKNILENCRNLKYIGMCCSLYDESSANVDIAICRQLGIKVLGVRDYGDEGVVEFVISEIIRLLHGFGEKQWKANELDITGQKVGIIGFGTTGIMVANALKLFGADVYYYSRTRKVEYENTFKYLNLNELLNTVDIISTHLPKHTRILSANELKLYGDNKIIINTSIGPTYDIDAMKAWLNNKNNYLICDQVAMPNSELFGSNVLYTRKAGADTLQTKIRLSNKVLDNIKIYLNEYNSLK